MITPAQRWRNLREHLRFKYGPKLVDWLMDKATRRARSKLQSFASRRILVDNTVLYHAVTHETAWVSTGKSNWGPHEIDTGYSARIPVYPADSGSREYRHIRYLPGIAHLCRAGLLELVTSAELQDEQFRQPSGRYRGYGMFDHSLFGALDIPSVDGHVFPDMGPSWLNLPSPEDQQRERINRHRADPIFDALVRILGPTNSQDAWHIYTAETHGCLCFLTMDFKLIRTVAAQAKTIPLTGFTTRVMTPEDLGRELGLIRVPPHLFSYHDASFFVRSDLSMPTGKRRPHKEYRQPRP